MSLIIAESAKFVTIFLSHPEKNLSVRSIFPVEFENRAAARAYIREKYGDLRPVAEYWEYDRKTGHYVMDKFHKNRK